MKSLVWMTAMAIDLGLVICFEMNAHIGFSVLYSP